MPVRAPQISYNAGRAPYDSVRCRTVPGRAPADVFIYRRRTVPVRYVTTQKKIIKNRPGDYQIRRRCAHRWNRTMSVLFVTIAFRVS